MNKKLSHNTGSNILPVEEWKSWDSTETPSHSAESDFTGSESEASEFSLHEQLWDLIDRDPKVSQRIEELVDQRALEVCEKRNQEMLEALKSKAFEQGYEKGCEKARLEMNEALSQLSELGDKVQSSLSIFPTALQSHFLKALKHVFHRFLVEDSARKIELSKQWIEECCEEMGTKSIVIYASPNAHALLNTELSGLECKIDETLAGVSIRCESPDGGLVFDFDSQVKRLEELVDQYHPNSD